MRARTKIIGLVAVALTYCVVVAAWEAISIASYFEREIAGMERQWETRARAHARLRLKLLTAYASLSCDEGPDIPFHASPELRTMSRVPSWPNPVRRELSAKATTWLLRAPGLRSVLPWYLNRLTHEINVGDPVSALGSPVVLRATISVFRPVRPDDPAPVDDEGASDESVSGVGPIDALVVESATQETVAWRYNVVDNFETGEGKSSVYGLRLKQTVCIFGWSSRKLLGRHTFELDPPTRVSSGAHFYTRRGIFPGLPGDATRRVYYDSMSFHVENWVQRGD